MAAGATRLDSTELIAAVSRLEIRAREVVEGVISGLHRSPYHGFSVEFAQHREYTPGDEIRTIDWKVAGRTDRYYVKEFEEETNLKAHLLLDSSRSMSYRGGGSKQSKYEYACLLATAFAFLLLRQRDAAGLAIFAEQTRRFLPPRSTPSHLTHMMESMLEIEPAGPTGAGATLHALADQVRRRGLVVLLSDLFTDPLDVLAGLKHFRYRGHEIIVFQVLDPDEVEFPFEGLTRFEDLESDERLVLDPRGIRDVYLTAFREFREKLERGCREIRVDFVTARTDQDPAALLTSYMAGRQRRA